MDKKKILICIPSIRDDKDFFLSILSFVESLRTKFVVGILIEKWQDMATVQNKMADYFMQNDFDYMLFCEDDCTGHSLEMLECLINANASIAAIQAFNRHYPYPNLLLNGDTSDNLASGYSDITLTGHQMLLIRREVFANMAKPYFVAKHDGVAAWSTDQLFFARAKELGLSIKGCWDFCITHAGINKDNVTELRERNAPSYLDRFIGFHKKGV